MIGSYNAIILRLALLTVLACLVIPILSCDTGDNNLAELSGIVRSGDRPVDLSTVTLYSTGTGQGPQVLGQSQSDASGFFSISYRRTSDANAVLYLTADSSLINPSQPSQAPASDFIRLATVLGTPPVVSEIVINERTTIATAYALAQFVTPTGIDGTAPGLQNAAATARNLVDVQTGEVGSVLGLFPNGNITSTMATFNSLSNLLATCVRTGSECPSLFSLATTPRGDEPANTFQAALNIAHFPWQNVQDLLSLSQQESLYSPALGPDADLQAWSLAVRYKGNGQELDGPGNIAFDKDGNAWIVNNYVFSLDPFDPQGKVCGGEQLFKFTPTGEGFPGAPYEGGGVYGAGFGVTLDTKGDVWVGNFAFQGSNCPNNIEELS